MSSIIHPVPLLIPFSVCRDSLHAHVRADTCNSTTLSPQTSNPPPPKNPPSSPDSTPLCDIPTVNVRCIVTYTHCIVLQIYCVPHCNNDQLPFHGVFQENCDQYSNLVRPSISLTSSHPVHTTHDSNNYSKLNQVTP